MSMTMAVTAAAVTMAVTMALTAVPGRRARACLKLHVVIDIERDPLARPCVGVVTMQLADLVGHRHIEDELAAVIGETNHVSVLVVTEKHIQLDVIDLHQQKAAPISLALKNPLRL
jgi:hypothetical protein